MEWVRYGGRKGQTHPLAVSEEYVAVRTHSGAALDPHGLSSRSRDVAHRLERLFRLPAVGVEVHRVVARGARRGVHELPDLRDLRGLRDRARSALKQEPELRFAGRVLCDPKTREPVLYTENLFVKFGDHQAPSRCLRAIEQAELTVKREIDYLRNGYFVQGPEGCGTKIFAAARDLLAGDDGVELCHPELVWEGSRRLPLPFQWHLGAVEIGGARIEAHAAVEAAWTTTRGEGTVIAVIDDGFDLDHEELASPDKIVAPRDATEDSDDPRPGRDDDHGTPCAGVACADGLHEAAGVAPAARLMPIRLVSGIGSQNEADAIQYAADHGADVISCSWGPKDGDPFDPTDPLHDAVHPLPDATRLALEWATDHGRGGRGCVITWAAGNGGESVDHDGYASCERVIAVAACNDQGRRSPYSDRGDAIWCCFPSNDFDSVQTTGIWTTDRTGGAGFNPRRSSLGDRRGNYTNRFQGTSSACPGVAGVAALVLSVRPELSWREVRDLLAETADRIDAERAPDQGGYGSDGHSPWYGFGRVNAGRAVARARTLAAAGAAPAVQPPAPTAAPSEGAAAAVAPVAASPPTAGAAGATRAAAPTSADVGVRVETEARQVVIWIDDRRLALAGGGGRTRLSIGREYILSWWIEGEPGSRFRIEVDAGGHPVAGRLPAEGRIALDATKSADARKLMVRAR